MPYYSKNAIGALRAVPLEAVLRVLGATQDKDDYLKWHTTEGVISIQNAKFFNWIRNIGGGGAIDLAMHLNNLDFKEAIHWLEQHFPQADRQQAKTHLALNPRTFKLPAPDPTKLYHVKNYLTHTRAIPIGILQPLINQGLIYADQRLNAVFLLQGYNKTLVGAELRSTTTSTWRGMAPGSNKNKGFFAVSPADALHGIILCESAIDAISCFTLNPKYQCISTAGARTNPQWLNDIVKREIPLYCGFDNDATGENNARAMNGLYPSIQRLRPPEHDWNDTLLCAKQLSSYTCLQ